MISVRQTSLRMLLLLAYSGFFYVNFVNQAVFGAAAILCLASDIGIGTDNRNWKIGKKEFLFLCMAVLCVGMAFLTTGGSLVNRNMPLYWLFWAIYVVYVTYDVEGFKEAIYADERFITAITKLWNIIVLVCIFIPQCYVYSGGSRGFVGFTGVDAASGGNRLCPIALLMMTMVYVCMVCYKNKRMFIYSIPCMYVFFMGGSRTYFAVGSALFVVLLYNFFEKKRYFYLTIIPVVLGGYALISVSTMGARIAGNTWTSSSYGDYWYVLTSGRSVFWNKMLTAYMEQDWFHKLFGNGFNFTMETGGHWGHNDFVEILCCYGIVGILMYLGSIRLLFKKVLGVIQMPWIIRILVIFIWLFNAFFNMFYTYLCAAVAFPFLLCGLESEYGYGPMNLLKTTGEGNKEHGN